MEFDSLIARLADQFPIVELIGAAGRLQGEGQIDKAILLYRLWLKCNPTEALRYVAMFNLGTLLSGINDLQGARGAFEQAIEANADFYPAYINLGGVLERLGGPNDAVNIWSTIVRRLPAITGQSVNHKITAFKQIARVLETSHRDVEAEQALWHGLSLDPEQTDMAQHYLALRMAQCEWPVAKPWEGVSHRDLMNGLSPLSLGAYTDDPLFQLAGAYHYNRSIADPPVGTEFMWQQVERRPSERLRIGYLSSDLREHAIGFLMSELFELHDRKTVEVFAYYCGIKPEDGIKTRIRDAVEHWVDITAMDDVTAARRMAEDNIDILIDVNGNTKDARTKVLTYRPAPVIVNWLGFPGSMGSPYHQYIIADEWIIPKDSEIYYSEKVVRLPCYQPNDRKRNIAADRPTREQMGLPENAVVFCCFNGSQKITRFTFDRWMRILANVPDSVLWLLGNNEPVHQRLRQMAVERGVAPERIVFAGKMPNPRHLARYPLADLFLDTFPYGAHTTASDALWMGVPVLTFSGRGFASRVCGSLVRSANLPDLVCSTPDDYVAKAIALGNDRDALRQYKDKLEANRHSCALFDMDAHTRSLEGLYREMWREFEQGRIPVPNLINLEIYREMACEEDHEAAEMLAVDDYNGFYRRKLAARHKFRPIPEDTRLWTAVDIRLAENKG